MRPFFAALLVPISLFGMILVALALFVVTLPNVAEMRGCITTNMYHVKLCPGAGNYTKYSEISTDLLNAIVASEDASFYFHNGFDWFEIRQSFTTNLKSRGFKRGGSTITQQLAKNVFLNQDKSILRKFREAAITILIEKNFSKKEILEKYLNVVEFGPNIFGVSQAARVYFDKRPSDLNLLESTFLAFLLPNPKVYSESFRKGQLSPFAKKILTNLIRRLEGFKKISPSTAEMALSHLGEFPWRGLGNGPASGEEVDPKAEPSADQIEEFLSEEPIIETPEEESESSWD